MPPVSTRSTEQTTSVNVEFDPRILLTTLRHAWYWATPLGLAFAIAASFAVYAAFVPMFRATHVLEINNRYVVFEDSADVGGNARTERQIISSDFVLDDVVTKPDVQAAGYTDPEMAKTRIRAKLTVSNPSTSLLSISYEAADAKESAIVCNAVTDSFISRRELLDNRKVDNFEAWLTPSIDVWKAEVEGYERRIEQLSKSALGFDPNNPVEALEFDIQTLGQLRRELQDLRLQESWMESELANSRSDSPKRPTEDKMAWLPEPTSSEIEAFVAAAPDVVRLQGLLEAKKTTLRSMEEKGLKTLRQDYYTDLEKKASELDAQLLAAKETARSLAVDAIKQRFAEAAARSQELLAQQQAASNIEQADSAKQELARIKAKRALIASEYEIEKEKLERKGGNAVELMFAKDDRAIAVEILGTMQQKLAETKIERRRGSGVSSVSPASPPSTPTQKIPYRNMIVAGILGMLAPFGIGLLLEIRSKRVSDTHLLEQASLAPFGEVAKIPSRTGQTKKQRVFEESIDTLRANLMLSQETKGARTVTIASSMSGEGKSSVSSQLAISLAKACGETVLLIDADLRSPDQHDIFGLEMGPGLSSVLSGESTLDNATDHTLGELVHVLPAGRMTQSPHRLLSSDRVRNLLDEALDKYRYVVIDTAPVLSAGETLAIAGETDVTLVCVMRDLSRAESVLRSSRRLEAAGAHVVGTVFSGVPSRQYAYRYGDYRYLTAQISS